MKPHICIILSACFLLSTFTAAPANPVTNDVVYVIPIKGMIERGLLYVIRRGVAEAEQNGAAAIILDMDTPGGRLDSAKEIINIIGNINVKTYTFVNTDAISAGAIIALATDHIYMAPGSRIGDAMPLMMSPFGSVQEMPANLQEKISSPTAALIRAAAQRKNHDPQLAEAMVRPDIEYKIGDKIISKQGELLTLTNVEAEQMVGEKKQKHPLLSSGTVANIDELLKKIGLQNSQLKVLEISSLEKIARYIELFSALLLIGGLLGIYIEFKTPGFGLPGILGAILLLIWFWGYHIAGMAGMGEIVLFMAGFILLMIELFLIPGFGIVGVTGISLMTTSLFLAMVEHYPGGSWLNISPHFMQVSIMNLGGSLVGTFFFVIILARFLPETHIFQRIMLGTTLAPEKGFVASDKTDDMIGIRGTALTPLHPAGIGIFGNNRLNVIARGDFIEKDSSIIIAETHGNRIVVEPVKNSNSEV